MASAESTNHELNTDNSQQIKKGVKMPSVATVTDGALKNNDGKAIFLLCQNVLGKIQGSFGSGLVC